MTDKPSSGDEQAVTVAELMARYGVEPSAKGRAHRRRARAGGVSVAELTGEIPALTPETLAAHAETARADDDAESAVDGPAADAEAEVETADPADIETETQEAPADAGDTAAEAPDEDPAPHADDETVTPVADDDVPAGDLVADIAAQTDDTADADDTDVTDDATAVFAAAETAPSTPDTGAPADPAAATAATAVAEDAAGAPAQAAERADAVWRRPAGPVTVIPPIAHDFDDRWPGEDGAAEDTGPGLSGPAEASAGPDPAAAGQEAQRPSFGSALRQWFGLAAQTVLGVVVGAAVFLGFIRLWDVLPYVALVLAVLVILAMAAVVRILRKTDDSVSILLAVVVGVIVTIGPLVFVLSSP